MKKNLPVPHPFAFFLGERVGSHEGKMQGMHQPQRLPRPRRVFAVAPREEFSDLQSSALVPCFSHISRSASTSTIRLRRGIPASSARLSIPRNASLSALREALFKIMWKR